MAERFENYSEAKESELSKKNNLLNELRGSAVFIEQAINGDVSSFLQPENLVHKWFFMCVCNEIGELYKIND